jgi:hypothetical protein
MVVTPWIGNLTNRPEIIGVTTMSTFTIQSQKTLGQRRMTPSNAPTPGLPDTVSAAVIRLLDHFIHKYEPNMHDQTSFILYSQWNLKPPLIHI